MLIHMSMLMSMHMLTHVSAHVDTHVLTHAHAHVYTYVYAHVYPLVYTHVYAHAAYTWLWNANRRACAYTCLHKYMPMHTSMHMWPTWWRASLGHTNSRHGHSTFFF